MDNRAIKRHITKGSTQYVPVNPKKYRGKPPIICRSSWEEAFCRWCDHSQSVLSWASEEIVVKYVDPIEPVKFKTKKPNIRNYYPDFILENQLGEIYLIEVKPYKQTIQPKRSSRKSSRTMLTEEKNWKINTAKWKAARSLCARKGWIFKIMTEKELFGKK